MRHRDARAGEADSESESQAEGTAWPCVAAQKRRVAAEDSEAWEVCAREVPDSFRDSACWSGPAVPVTMTVQGRRPGPARGREILVTAPAGDRHRPA